LNIKDLVLIPPHALPTQESELNVRLYQDALQALNAITTSVLPFNFKLSIKQALSVACQYLKMDVGVVSQMEQETCFIQVAYTANDRLNEESLHTLLAHHCAALRDSTDIIAIENLAQSPNTHFTVDELPDYQSMISVQLRQEAVLYGSLVFFAKHVRAQAFTSSEHEFIQILSNWMMHIVKRHELDAQLRSANEKMALALSGGNLGLWELDLQTEQTVFNERWAHMLGYQLSELEQSFAAWKRLLHPEDVQQALNALSAHVADEMVEFNLEYRMQHKDGHWVWVHNRGRVIAHNGFGEPVRMVGTHLDVTAHKNAAEEIKQLAFYDVLTSLPNRRLLIDRLEHALVNSARSKCHGALIFIDLDNFKTLNDTLGHEKGDALLKRVATRLLSCLRDGDTVARFGGDEFVVMLDNLDETMDVAIQQVEKVGDKIIQSLNQPYDLGGQQYFSSPTLGATLFNGQNDKVDDSLKRADIAMYQAKSAGKNCLRFFDQHIQANLLHKTQLAEDLRHGIDNEQFVLYYQPQIDSHGQITGAEALVRWHHPERGLVSPLEFIPLAEETGLITQLGSWVIETGCKQLLAWSKNPQASEFNLSINVSARQFHQPDFVAQVLETLEKTGANPHKLKLELTESMLVDDVDDVITKMSQLRLRGVSFSLDDFGTGFSSLSFLKLLPLNQLKIDKSFVRDVLTDNNDAVIARTIVALANSLGLTVIAEGVEMEGQRDFLAENGCYDYQGYLFSRPLTIQDFDTYSQSFNSNNQAMQDLLESAISRPLQASLFV
jgi:diguanylate cyclase (GGDEF)-like protein/PAS domain S-box-containing protein